MTEEAIQQDIAEAEGLRDFDERRLRDPLTAALAVYDAAVAKCPINKPGGAHTPVCPRCKAASNDPCFVDVTAAGPLIETLRAVLSDGGALGWEPTACAPDDGSLIDVRSITTYRHHFGDWLRATEDGGWESAELPEGEWCPNRPYGRAA